jgi:hypothetical protein
MKNLLPIEFQQTFSTRTQYFGRWFYFLLWVTGYCIEILFSMRAATVQIKPSLLILWQVNKSGFNQKKLHSIWHGYVSAILTNADAYCLDMSLLQYISDK